MVIKNFTVKKLHRGFTLAEVLITLVIIGVIAAMTIPTLMKNTQKQEFVAGVKKANSVLSQALLNVARNNDAAVGDFSFLTEVNLIDELAKVTNVIKKCNTTSECFGSDYATKYKRLSGSSTAGSGLGADNEGKAMITSDGAIYLVYYVSNFEISKAHGLSDEDAHNSIGNIIVDVNGDKGPNLWGRDVFLFELTKTKGLVPAGSETTSSCNKNGSGFGCAARVLKENAMNY